MSKRTLFLIFALFLITAVLLVIALYRPQAPKTTQIITPTQEPVAQTVLSFGNPEIATSSSLSVLNYSLPINISTGKNKVTAVQLEIQYDPEILINVDVTPGPFFTNPTVLLNQIDAKTGRISYAFGVGMEDEGVVGKGNVAILTFSTNTQALQKTALIFLPKTLVAAQGIRESVLKQTLVGQFNLGKISSSPSPVPAQ